KYKADGTEIVYTVKEDDVAGYTSEVTGDANTGFTVTNTQIPPHETPKPKKPSKKVQKVPYTGDAGVLGTVVPLTAGAIVLLGAGIFLGKKDK
ncbi:Cna B-type domain-containing protein, partial [Lancefieldella rimae]|uniref:Cna B-type domain-containing protein n=1 Tax=Lancefieldella rimae TaxID=1383 RepID=UPI001CB12338